MIIKLGPSEGLVQHYVLCVNFRVLQYGLCRKMSLIITSQKSVLFIKSQPAKCTVMSYRYNRDGYTKQNVKQVICSIRSYVSNTVFVLQIVLNIPKVEQIYFYPYLFSAEISRIRAN